MAIKTCMACNEYQTAGVAKFCPHHRYCTCEVAETEDDGIVCINCKKEIDPSIIEYYNDLQIEAKMESMRGEL